MKGLNVAAIAALVSTLPACGSVPGRRNYPEWYAMRGDDRGGIDPASVFAQVYEGPYGIGTGEVDIARRSLLDKFYDVHGRGPTEGEEDFIVCTAAPGDASNVVVGEKVDAIVKESRAKRVAAVTGNRDVPDGAGAEVGGFDVVGNDGVGFIPVFLEYYKREALGICVFADEPLSHAQIRTDGSFVMDDMADFDAMLPLSEPPGLVKIRDDFSGGGVPKEIKEMTDDSLRKEFDTLKLRITRLSLDYDKLYRWEEKWRISIENNIFSKMLNQITTERDRLSDRLKTIALELERRGLYKPEVSP